jgi:Rrf2 family transcriptional regulator, iron-sulfur cluster assembly transcription factor
MMGLTRKAEYGIRGMLFLANQPEGVFNMLETISREVDAPRPFLAKVLQALANKGLIVSSRGVGGGFILARPPEQITLCEIVEAIDGPIMPNQCLMDDDVCSLQKSCQVHPVWRRLQTVARGILLEVTLKTLTAEKRGA